MHLAFEQAIVRPINQRKTTMSTIQQPHTYPDYANADPAMGGKAPFVVIALYDRNVPVYYSDSNIFGLNIETETLDEFIETANELAPMLIKETHGTHQYPPDEFEDAGIRRAVAEGTPMNAGALQKVRASTPAQSFHDADDINCQVAHVLFYPASSPTDASASDREQADRHVSA